MSKPSAKAVVAELDPKIMSAVEARLAAVNDEEPEPVEAVEAKTPDTVIEDNKPTPKEIVKPLEQPEPDETPGKKAETKVEELPEELPWNFHRAALASGWTDDAIQDFVVANPKMAYNTFQNIFMTQQRTSAAFADLGRRSATPAATAPANTPAAKKEEIPDSDIKAIKDQFGDDPILSGVDALLMARFKKFDEKLERLSVPSNPVNSERAKTPAEEQLAVVEQVIENFFNGGPVAQYFGEFYGSGKDPGGRTLDQVSRREELLQTADQIMVGAKAQGLNPSVNEVLERAHWMVSAPATKAAVRNEIKATAVARSKGISLRTSKVATPPPSAGNRTQSELEQIVAGRLQGIFG